jgi:hypothetical protein
MGDKSPKDKEKKTKKATKKTVTPSSTVIPGSKTK